MKKRVLILLSLAMMISLAAIAYSAAVTNPGHGVEEIGSGSSPYATRMWNALNTGYQDYYTGPSALRGLISWLGTNNAETTAAQNALGDYCVIQTAPKGVYINCLNNATKITLTQSYYWNGTNFTKNDTIRNESHVFEEEIIQAGAAGTTISTTLANPNSGTITTSCSATSPPTCTNQINDPTGTDTITQETTITGGGVPQIQSILVNDGGTVTTNTLSADANGGTFGVEIDGPGGESTDITGSITGGFVVGVDSTGLGDGGGLDIGQTGVGTEFLIAGATVASTDLTENGLNDGVITSTATNTDGETTILQLDSLGGNDNLATDSGRVNLYPWAGCTSTNPCVAPAAIGNTNLGPNSHPFTLYCSAPDCDAMCALAGASDDPNDALGCLTGLSNIAGHVTCDTPCDLAGPAFTLCVCGPLPT